MTFTPVLIRTTDDLISAVRRRRAELGLSAEEIDHKVGLTRGYTTKLENWSKAWGRRGFYLCTRLSSWLREKHGVALVLIDRDTKFDETELIVITPEEAQIINQLAIFDGVPELSPEEVDRRYSNSVARSESARQRAMNMTPDQRMAKARKAGSKNNKQRQAALARAASQSPERRSAIAKAAAQARWTKRREDTNRRDAPSVTSALFGDGF